MPYSISPAYLSFIPGFIFSDIQVKMALGTLQSCLSVHSKNLPDATPGPDRLIPAPWGPQQRLLWQHLQQPHDALQQLVHGSGQMQLVACGFVHFHPQSPEHASACRITHEAGHPLMPADVSLTLLCMVKLCCRFVETQPQTTLYLTLTVVISSCHASCGICLQSLCKPHIGQVAFA